MAYEDDVVEAIRARLAKGRVEHGPLWPGKRAWTKEALEELLDTVVYLTLALMEWERRDADAEARGERRGIERAAIVCEMHSVNTIALAEKIRALRVGTEK